MPSKNEVKIYVEKAYYHLYNRGVEKRDIFLDKQDYSVFLTYLKTYLLPKDEQKLQMLLIDPKTDYRKRDKIAKMLQLNNFCNDLKLLAYCLMTNHFHLLVYQIDRDSIHKFMNSLITRYSMYFNKKYKRVGPLFQGVYKAVLVKTDEQLLHLSRYIHLQAINLQGQPLRDQPSSYPNYLGEISQEWVRSDDILEFFKTGELRRSLGEKDTNMYKSFVEGYNLSEREEFIADLVLDS